MFVFLVQRMSLIRTIMLLCTDLKKILELDPSNDQARKGIRRLEPLAVEKREKMKEEAIGKKDLVMFLVKSTKS